MQTETTHSPPQSAPRGQLRRELAEFARSFLIRYESEGFYFDTAPRLRGLAVPRDCFALIIPRAQVASALWFLAVILFLGIVLRIAMDLVPF